MRIANWNPKQFDREFAHVCMTRLKAAANIIANHARHEVPVGNITRSVYESGKYKGEEWTARKPGALKKTIRVVELYEKYGVELANFRNVRVYAGNKTVFYARLVEYTVKPFMRKAKRKALPMVKTVLGVREWQGNR